MSSIPEVILENGAFRFVTPVSKVSVLEKGFFALKIPDDFNVTCLQALAANFLQVASCSSLIVEGATDQSLSLSLTKSQLAILNSPDIEASVKTLGSIGVSLVDFIFNYLDLDQVLRKTILGRCANALNPDFVLAFNSYDPRRNFDVGMTSHKDMGWVNFVYPSTSGLELYSQGKWINVPPMKNHFLVNLGILWEILTMNLPCKILSPIHRVTCQRLISNASQNATTSRNSFVFSFGPQRGVVYTLQRASFSHILDGREIANSLKAVGRVQSLQRALANSYGQEEVSIERKIDSYLEDLDF